MNPIFIDLGLITIHWYGVFMALAFSAALLSWTLLGRRRAWRFQDCSDILFWVMIGGILGARFNYILSDFNTYKSDPLSIFKIHEGGLIFYGGLVCATLAVLILARLRKIPMLAMTDFVVTSVPLGHAFGRIGCFMNGCCFGRPADGLLSCTFPKYSPPWQDQFSQHYHDHLAANGLSPSATEMSIVERTFEGFPVFPVQLFETAANLCVYILLVVLFLKTRRSGIITGAYLLAYPLARFLLEDFRGTERIMFGAFSTAQYVSLALMSCGALVLWYAARNKHVYAGPGRIVESPAGTPGSSA